MQTMFAVKNTGSECKNYMLKFTTEIGIKIYL